MNAADKKFYKWWDSTGGKSVIRRQYAKCGWDAALIMVAQNSTSTNKQMDAIALLKKLFNRVQVEDSEACWFRIDFTLDIYNELEKIAQQH